MDMHVRTGDVSTRPSRPLTGRAHVCCTVPTEPGVSRPSSGHLSQSARLYLFPPAQVRHSIHSRLVTKRTTNLSYWFYSQAARLPSNCAFFLLIEQVHIQERQKGRATRDWPAVYAQAAVGAKRHVRHQIRRVRVCS